MPREMLYRSHYPTLQVNDEAATVSRYGTSFLLALFG